MRYLELELINDICQHLCKSYHEFIEHHNKIVFEITRKAQRSPLYRNRIKKIKKVEELCTLPLTFWDDIYSAFTTYGLESILLEPWEKWWQTSGHTGASKKFYYSRGDLEEIIKVGSRVAYITGIRPGDVFWNLGAADPYVSGALGTIIGERLKIKEIASKLGRLEDLIKGLKQISKVEKINVVSGIPLIYLAIGRIVNDPETFKKEVQRKIEERLHLPAILSKVIGAVYLRGINYKKIKKSLENTKVGFLYAEPLEPHLENLRVLYPKMQARDAYGSTELLIGAVQLSNEPGLSVLLDWFIPEIAKPEDIMKAKNNPKHKVKSIPWWKWTKGLRGELIATRNGGCLPLIRYPTGDLVEVVDPARTTHINFGSLGEVSITLPIIRILGRSTELIDFSLPEEMGIFMGGKVYSRQIKDAMAWVRKHGKVRWWDLYIHPPTKEVPFTKFKFEVVPAEEIKDEKAFKKEVKLLLRRECDELDYLLKQVENVYPKEYVENLLEINILPPRAYEEKVQKEIERRIKEGRPLGQLKPKQIHYVKQK
jgi:phenylacetate-coenzyme A ligase PaaK-like adenylate-forming protein